MAEEGLKKTRNELIHIGCPIPFEVETFLKELETLMGMAYINADNIREKVAEVVTTYHPAGEHGSEKKGEVYERLLGEESAFAPVVLMPKLAYDMFVRDQRRLVKVLAILCYFLFFAYNIYVNIGYGAIKDFYISWN